MALFRSQLEALIRFSLLSFMDTNDMDTRGIENQSAQISTGQAS